MNRYARFLLLLVSLGVLAARAGLAQVPAVERPLFANDEPLTLRINAPISDLDPDREGNRPELDGTLAVIGPDGSETELHDIEVRVRGKSRLRLCDFPPLRIDFDRDEVAGTVFAGQNQLKLVTLCKRSQSYRVYLDQEYLIYRLFNELTDYSMRVRWANVEYVDESGRGNVTEAPAFFIEEDWEVAERLGLDVNETAQVRIADLDGGNATLLALFHYLIGNTDWEIAAAPDEESCCHNGKPIGTDGGPVYLIPYDFDNAGLINAEYAVPSERLPIRRVTVRYYRGFCAYNDEVEVAVAHLNESRAALERVLEDPLVSARAQSSSQRFLATSYDRLNNERWLEREVYRGCRR